MNYTNTRAVIILLALAFVCGCKPEEIESERLIEENEIISVIKVRQNTTPVFDLEIHHKIYNIHSSHPDTLIFASLKNIAGYNIDSAAIRLTVFKGTQHIADSILYNVSKPFGAIDNGQTSDSFAISFFPTMLLNEQNTIAEVVYQRIDTVTNYSNLYGTHIQGYYLGTDSVNIVYANQNFNGFIQSDGNLSINLNGTYAFKKIQGFINPLGFMNANVLSANDSIMGIVDNFSLTPVQLINSDSIEIILSCQPYLGNIQTLTLRGNKY